jgi:cyclopropane-fatty-acyl-phospholipid synthase
MDQTMLVLSSPQPITASSRLFRHLVHQRLSQLTRNRLRLSDSRGEVTFGPATSATAADLTIHHPRFYRRIALGGSLAFAEAYLDGDWTTTNLPRLLGLFADELGASESHDRWSDWLLKPARRLANVAKRNTRDGSRRNIAAHYDLSNEFYALWLDETLTYSAGIFPTPQTTLAEASREKYDRMCRMVDLQPGDRLLEIGTGWGGFALHAAENYGCHVTTTTISQQQFDYAQRLIAACGSADRITLLQHDYRVLRGEFDKLVSIEMIEAVGHEYLPTFFGVCNRLLRTGGRMAIQGITIPDQRYAAYRRGVDFIQKYIFPGGALPSLGSIASAITKNTQLQVTTFTDHAADYERTLLVWRRQFFAKLTEVHALGFDERFVRMWDYYLCYCAAAFAHRRVGLAQMGLVKAS